MKATYKGPARAEQRWIWRILDWQQSKWILLGDNQTAASWQRSDLSFTAGGTLANYVHLTTRQIRVRVQSANTTDDMDLDYEALFVTGGVAPPAPTWWQPTPDTSWQIQLQGTIDTAFNVQLYIIDLFDTPQATIQQLHQQGRKIVCYFSAGSLASSPLNILLPLYIYPTWWDATTYLWDDVAAANSIAPITAIINPHNGPNGTPQLLL